MSVNYLFRELCAGVEKIPLLSIFAFRFGWLELFILLAKLRSFAVPFDDMRCLFVSMVCFLTLRWA